MLINCIIVDDESRAIEIIQRHVDKVKILNLVGTFGTAQDALTFMSHNKVDLIFLDINMPDLSGTEMAALVDEKIKIIFTTAYPEYAIKGFEVNAVDYLLKPVTFEKFSKAILKLNNYFGREDSMRSDIHSEQGKEKAPKIIFLKSGTALYKINIESIKYLEKEGNYFKLITEEKSLLIRINFANLLDKLPTSQFVRIHKSYIVNLMQIEKIEIDTVLVNNVTLPIGFSFRNELNEAVEKFVQGSN